LEYIPYGETFVDERYSTWHSPYKFNGKERDEETGLTYYGARYFDGNVWYTSDELKHKHPNIGSYVYCFGNPVKYRDPDGRDAVTASGIEVITQEVSGAVGGTVVGAPAVPFIEIIGTAWALWELIKDAPIKPANADNQSKSSTSQGQSQPSSSSGQAGNNGEKKGDDKNSNKNNKETGSYTNVHESGKKYHGKGDQNRMNQSGKRIEERHNDPVKSQDWTPAENDREAFKQESKRIDTDKQNGRPGHKSDNNYNQRASPGDKYRKHDGN
jgi:RHS repeat-associated protein